MPPQGVVNRFSQTRASKSPFSFDATGFTNKSEGGSFSNKFRVNVFKNDVGSGVIRKCQGKEIRRDRFEPILRGGQ